jgi:predicted permease
MRSLLAVGQLVFSVVALTSAALFLRSLSQAKAVDLGFDDPEHLLLVATDLSQLGVAEPEAQAVVERLLERYRSLPGVTRASAATAVPLGFGGHLRVPTEIEEYVPARDETMSIERVSVFPDYFATMGIRIIKGRAIAESDLAGTLRVAVVNESFVAKYWAGQDPIGKRIRQGPGWATVVGLARDGRYDSPATPSYPLIYTAGRQWFRSGLTILLRTSQDPRALIEPAREAAASTHADLPFLDPRTMAEHMQASTFVQRLGGAVLGGLGVIALLLAALGLYAVIAFGVTERTAEIGIRLALGQSTGGVLRHVLMGAFRLIAVGLLVGVGLTLAVGRLFQAQLIGISATDPVSLGGIALLLAITALLASWIPARRAARLSPSLALRLE